MNLMEAPLRDLTLNEEKQKDLIHRLTKVKALYRNLEIRQKEFSDALQKMGSDLCREIKSLKKTIEIDIDSNSKETKRT